MKLRPLIGRVNKHWQEPRNSPLKDLPFELHLQILGLMDLRDTIAYRKTCKLFLFITSQRIIWVDLLRRVCSKNSVFKPTFPIEEMSVIDLEQAVSAPTRWLNQVMSSNTDTIRSSRDMITITPLENPHFFGVFLVPGGRFLVTFSEIDVCVWDLGYSSSAILKGAPLASAPCVPNHEFAVVPTTDELGLWICVSASCGETRNEMCDEFWIFEIYPLSDKPALSKIASLVYEDYHKKRLFSLHGDLLILHAPNYVKVWNFVTNMSVKFDVGDEPFEKAWVTAESVILFRLGMISVWSIPPLTPDGHPEETQDHFLQPSVEFPFSKGWNLSRDEIPSEWYTDHPIVCDYFCHASVSYMLRFEIILPEGRFEERNELVLPSTGFFEPYRVCNESLVMCYSNPKYVRVTAAPIYGELETDSDLEDVIIPPDSDLEDVAVLRLEGFGFSLCPVAGRLCRISFKRDSIIILDYLAPPPP